jgi:hypothetical protein
VRHPGTGRFLQAALLGTILSGMTTKIAFRPAAPRRHPGIWLGKLFVEFSETKSGFFPGEQAGPFQAGL